MSENPFATPAPLSGGAGAQVSQKAPGGLTALLIICLVLGILGLIGTCIGAATLGFQSQLQGWQQNMGDPTQQALQKEIQKIQNEQLIPTIIMLGINFIVAPLLTIGAIGGLNRKPWGHKWLGIGLLLAILYTVVKLVVTTVLQIMSMGPMASAMEKAMAEQGAAGGAEAKAAEIMGGAMQIGIVVGIVIAAIWGLILLGFYIWGWMYLRKDAVRNYFGIAQL